MSDPTDFHEHDAAGCLDCSCASAPMNSAPYTRPAAPETETDANAMWALSTPSLWESPDDRSIPTLLAAIGQVLQQPSAALDAARERVRVVEGERNAARGDLVFSRQTTTNVMEALADSGAETLAALARAESAEAAHEAEKAAHGKVWSLLGEHFDFNADPWQDHDAACPAPEDLWRLHRDLRSLLGGGEAR